MEGRATEVAQLRAGHLWEGACAEGTAHVSSLERSCPFDAVVIDASELTANELAESRGVKPGRGAAGSQRAPLVS